MRKMVLRMSAGAGTGMDTAVFYHVPEQYTEEFLSDYAWQSALDWAESFGLEPYPDAADCSDEDEYGGDLDVGQYTDDISGHFEVYIPEKHDGLRVGRDLSWQDI